MGVCVSKPKAAKPNANGNHHQTPIQYTISPAYAAQLPHIPAPAPANTRSTILGRPYEDVKAHYRLGKELGRGQFGVTHLCTDMVTGQQYACKSISKKKVVTKSEKEDMRREIQIMQHLSGQPNIVEFKGAYEDKHSVHLVMELCAGGELFDRIIAKGHYSERVLRLFFINTLFTEEVC